MEQFMKGLRIYFDTLLKKIPLPLGIVWILIILAIYLIYKIFTKLIEKALLKASRGDING